MDRAKVEFPLFPLNLRGYFQPADGVRRPASSIRLRTATPTAASACCPEKLRARRCQYWPPGCWHHWEHVRVGILCIATIPPGDIGLDHTRQNGSFCRAVNETCESGFAAPRSEKGREQVLLAVRAGIGWVSALLRHRREGAHQLQGALVADKNILQFLTARTAALDGADPIGFRIEHRMAHTLAVPLHSLYFQHFQAIIPPFGQIRPVQNSAEENKSGADQFSFSVSSSGHSGDWTARVLSYLRSASIRDQ